MPPAEQLPKEFRRLVREQLGAEAEALFEALNQSAPTSIRLNPCKPCPLTPTGEPIPWHPQGRYLSERPRFTLRPEFHAGAYYVQEASSMLLAEVLRQLLPQGETLRALDLCAAPGGKTTLLADALPPGSFVLANEVIRSRLPALQHNIWKWGRSNLHLASLDPAHFQPLENFFDLVLVDAPCSGEGLFRKDSDAMQHWSPQTVAHCAARQRRILGEAVRLVRQGGWLIYSTCTLNEAENAENARRQMEDFELEECPLNFPSGWGLVRRRVGWQCYPHRVRGEGFYFAAFRRKAGGRARLPKRSPTPPHLKPLSNRESSEPAAFFQQPEGFRFFIDSKGRVFALEEGQAETALFVQAVLKRCWVGVQVGKLKGKVFVPGPGLALFGGLSSRLPALDCSLEDSLQYLRGAPLPLEGAPRGWTRIRFAGLTLGWGKALDARLNNYFPKEWRIRLEGPGG